MGTYQTVGFEAVLVTRSYSRLAQSCLLFPGTSWRGAGWWSKRRCADSSQVVVYIRLFSSASTLAMQLVCCERGTIMLDRCSPRRLLV